MSTESLLGLAGPAAAVHVAEETCQCQIIHTGVADHEAFAFGDFHATAKLRVRLNKNNELLKGQFAFYRGR